MEDRGFFITLHAIRRQLAAMPNDLYLVRLIHQRTRQAFPGERLWTAQQLTGAATVRFLRARNREGCDVYVQPWVGHQNAGYILVDLDCARATIMATMRAQGHDPCVVVQYQSRTLASLDSSQLFAPGAGGCDRRWQTAGCGLWWRSGQHRLASPGKARRFHQSEARSPYAAWLSLGEGRQRTSRLGASS